jgi:hypothetical protein
VGGQFLVTTIPFEVYRFVGEGEEKKKVCALKLGHSDSFSLPGF